MCFQETAAGRYALAQKIKGYQAEDRAERQRQIALHKAKPKQGTATVVPFSSTATSNSAAPIVAAPTPAKPSDEMPEALAQVPGLLGDVVRWILDTNHKPNAALALGAAITVLGTLVGRAVAGPVRNNATHLYVVCVAPTGAGKEHPKNCCQLLLEAANAKDLIGPSGFKSSSAVANLLKRKPVSLCAIDELGMMLERILGPKAKSHDSEISSLLRELWGKNFTTYMTEEWASVPSVAIESPGLSIYGSSTLEELFAAMGGKDVMNGFVNRWLIFPTKKRTLGRVPPLQSGEVPHSLALALVNLRNWANRTTPEELAAPIGTIAPRKKLGWGANAEALAGELDQRQFDLESDDAKGAFFTRSREMALRLGVICAAGRLSDTLDHDDLAWGWEVAMWSANRMAALAKGNIAENDTQRLCNRIMGILAEKGGKATHSQIVQRLKRSVKSRDIADAMKVLVDGGDVNQLKITPPSGGTPTISYQLVAD